MSSQTVLRRSPRNLSNRSNLSQPISLTNNNKPKKKRKRRAKQTKKRKSHTNNINNSPIKNKRRRLSNNNNRNQPTDEEEKDIVLANTCEEDFVDPNDPNYNPNEDEEQQEQSDAEQRIEQPPTEPPAKTYEIVALECDAEQQTGSWGDDEILRVLKSGLNHQYFTTGDWNNIRGIQEDITNRTATCIKNKLLWINRWYPKVRAELHNVNNYKRRKIKIGNEKKAFTKTKLHQFSLTDWYKLYEEHLGHVTAPTAQVVGDAKTAQDVADKGGKAEKERRAQKAFQLSKHKQVEREALVSTKGKNDAIVLCLSNFAKKEYNKAKGVLNGALMAAVKIVKARENNDEKKEDAKVLKELQQKMKSNAAENIDYISQLATTIQFNGDTEMDTGLYLLNTLKLDAELDELFV